MKDKLDEKIALKRWSCLTKNLGFFLTKEQVQQLLDEAGITVDDWHIAGYNLARYGDQGDYTWGNCRFITASENVRERKVTEKWGIAARKNLLKCLGHTTEKTRLARSQNLANWRGGTVWIYNSELKLTKMIKQKDLQHYLELGWIKGRKIKYW